MSQSPDAVLIFAPTGDVHAQTVAWDVRRLGGRAFVLDSADFPSGWRIQFYTGPHHNSTCRIVPEAGDPIGAGELAGVWWRRPEDHKIPAEVEDEKHRRFCRNESRALLEGWAYSLGKRVINPLACEFAARRKPYQLFVASSLGLRTPKTVITNDPSAVRAFVADGGFHIYKILTNTPWQFTETRSVGEPEMDNLPLLATAPAIFQERVDGGPDIRVTIVDNCVFAAEVRANHPEAWLDWRLDMRIDVRPHQLPAGVERKLLEFQRAMGLRYGALDLRINESGEYVFFEVNPGGQYLFAEIHGKAPISDALAKALLHGPPDGSP